MNLLLKLVADYTRFTVITLMGMRPYIIGSVHHDKMKGDNLVDFAAFDPDGFQNIS